MDRVLAFIGSCGEMKGWEPRDWKVVDLALSKTVEEQPRQPVQGIQAASLLVPCHKQGLRWGSNVGPHDISGTLHNLLARSYRHHRFLSHQARQILEPGLVLGLCLEHIFFP
ncbi:hypothetical protein GOBAR_AA11473 [Gossypium barbadense]|uniref:Uncharacterized protein n=1 Tax=Gossypium barbadense TaxID=3634 RepID=A0A2P5Y0T1_GOSBA|nr:hypothetical protein GOBAR_AA11473 [Gossypium barbadense]